jgi:hypothetical protein
MPAQISREHKFLGVNREDWKPLNKIAVLLALPLTVHAWFCLNRR